MKLDPFDLKLLTELQRNGELTSGELAKLVHLSPSACLRRIQRLQEAGIIARQVAVLDPAKIGRPLTIIVLVALEIDSAATVEAFATWAASVDIVSQCYYVAGEYDFTLVVQAASMDEYERFTATLLHATPNVKRFTSVISLRKVKFDTALPLSHLDADATS